MREPKVELEAIRRPEFCREPAELCESPLWIRSDRVVRSHVGDANLPLPVDDVPRRQRKAIRRFSVKFIKRVAE